MLPDIYGTPEDYEDYEEDSDEYTDDEVQEFLDSLPPETIAELYSEVIEETAAEHGLSPELLATFVEASDGDLDAALEGYADWEARAAEVIAGRAASEPERDLDAFLAANPALDDDDFRAHVDAANGDIGQAIESYAAWLGHVEDAADEYDQHMERPRTMDEAFEQSFREGLIGNRDKLYRYRPSAHDRSLDKAVGEWVEEDSASRAVRDLARERVNEAAMGERDGF